MLGQYEADVSVDMWFVLVKYVSSEKLDTDPVSFRANSLSAYSALLRGLVALVLMIEINSFNIENIF